RSPVGPSPPYVFPAGSRSARPSSGPARSSCRSRTRRSWPPRWPSSRMFEPLYTAAEMRAAEERYPGYPDTVPELMERAGKAVADLVLEGFPDLRRITAVCGGGNNGGDGRVAARYLGEAGREVRVVDAKAGKTDLGEPEL